jgi:hypothetical protein
VNEIWDVVCMDCAFHGKIIKSADYLLTHCPSCGGGITAIRDTSFEKAFAVIVGDKHETG